MTTLALAVYWDLQLCIGPAPCLIVLEKYVIEYKDRFGLFPKHLEDLVTAGFLKEIPKDPHGGEYLIMENNRVYTTIRMIEQP